MPNKTTTKPVAAKNVIGKGKSLAIFKQALALVHQAREQVARQTNSLMVYTYFQLGRLIVEHEQGGKAKAAYGKETIKELSNRLTEKYGKGFSVDNLENMRLVYTTYKKRHTDFMISETPSRKSYNKQKPQTLSWKSFADIFSKIGKIKHKDIGQMQMYVNYYDRYVKTDVEKPSIGIIICKDKSDAVVEITLPKNNKTIFAKEYQLYLPSKAALVKLIKEK